MPRHGPFEARITARWLHSVRHLKRFAGPARDRLLARFGPTRFFKNVSVNISVGNGNITVFFLFLTVFLPSNPP